MNFVAYIFISVCQASLRVPANWKQRYCDKEEREKKKINVKEKKNEKEQTSDVL